MEHECDEECSSYLLTDKCDSAQIGKFSSVIRVEPGKRSTLLINVSHYCLWLSIMYTLADFAYNLKQSQ